MDAYTSAQELYDALCEPFAADEIDWRVGAGGRALAYIDARTVMDRLDNVCGPENWQNNYLFGPGSSLICNLGIKMPNGEWVWKADGAGATDIEAEKGAMSDALKRAAVRFGVGRYLYDLEGPKVQMDGKYIAKTERGRLDELHDRAASKVGWGGPANVAAYRFLHKVIEDTVTSADVVDAFRHKYKGMFALLRVKARRHLEQTLDRVGSPRAQAAE
jgi:hypothetical protein